MAESSGGDRTERATPKRRQEARRRGQVARSMELNGTVVLLVGMTAMLATTGHYSFHLQRNAAYLFRQAHLMKIDNLHGFRDLLTGNLEVLLQVMAPILLAVLVAGFLVNVLQVGFHASTQAMAFRVEKLNPITGAKKFFNKRAGFELVKNLLKIGLISTIAFTTIKGELFRIGTVPLVATHGAVAVGRSVLIELLAKLLVLMAILALVDWIFQKNQHEQSLKMTKVETKQEFKDMEGDPQVKARIRGIQLEHARKRMLGDVPLADVVITNPDHLAVALRYAPGDVAPKVLAKGRNHLAETIKKIARRAHVPVIENKPVARSLYREVEVGQWIPDSLYQVVAEVLAYVYRLKKS